MRPAAAPAAVPATPMVMPTAKNTRVIERAEAPTALRIPISLRFSATSKTRWPMIANAATSTMIVTTTKSASFSSWSGEQTPVHLHPVAHPVAEAELSGNDAAHVLGVEGVVQLDLDSGDPGEPGELLREGQAQIGDRGVVLVHPDLDRTGDGVAPHLGDHAHGRHGALR